ncbi:nitrate reductase [Vibrio sp. S4M6]|uniref:molybdopterin oxidoreductase family protein n=1 Tax=Vibrio sinus TaxID=2946865 RepID=UPI00202A6CEA|nr:nitrate reductase [Vibrio sinus]MCL9782542.1 nitrate reductase [Vibrio sinus]
MTDSKDGWIKTTCAYCGVGCGVEARPLSSGQLEVRGDKEHPANYGKLCTKGIALGETVTSIGRLLAPTIRTPHGEQQTDWTTALELVADRLNDTIAKHGPDSVAFYVSGQLLTEDYYVANKLMKGFIGSGNIDSNSRLCMASAVAGHKRAFGADVVPVCYEDLECTDMVVIVGSNLAWCHPVLFQRLRHAKQTNPSLVIVVIDPRETETSSIADTHLSIKSGSDVALFNGLLAYLDKHHLLDARFVEQHTQGLEAALRSAYEENGVEETTGLSTQELASFYASFSRCDKVVTIYSQGVNQSIQGTDKVNSIINCHLASGKIGEPGSGPFSVTGQPNAMGGREVGALANMLAAHMDFANPQHQKLVANFWGTDNVASQPGLKAVDMFNAINEGKIKAIWIMATNPAVSLPDNRTVQQALEKCPCVIVSDCIKDTDTTRFADVLLPAQGWSEKSGTVSNSERRISRQRRLLPSPGMAKPDWWIISKVAQKMGFEQAFDYLHEGEVFKEYANLTSVKQNECPRALNLQGLNTLSEAQYSKMLPQQWPVSEYQNHICQNRLLTNKQFYTSSKKAQFVAVKKLPLAQLATATLPLQLNTGRVRDQWHTMTRTGLSSRLANHTPEPFVAIHPETAKHYHLPQHALAEVSNQNGKIIARVEISASMSLGQIFVPIHWSCTNTNAGKPSQLIDAHCDAISGQPEFKSTPVMIKPFDYRSISIVLCREKLANFSPDYWCQQTIPQGYLYRVASQDDRNQLVDQILLSLKTSTSTATKQFESQQTMEWEYVRLSDTLCHAIVVVREDAMCFSEEYISNKIEQFNQKLDGENEAERFNFSEVSVAQ